MPLEVPALKCPCCESVVFSRANHDFRSCPCGAVSVDAGFSGYGGRIAWDGARVPEMPERFSLTLDEGVTQQVLYDDWNHGRNEYGIIRGPHALEKLAKAAAENEEGEEV